jgi:hypothetical protein
MEPAKAVPLLTGVLSTEKDYLSRRQLAKALGSAATGIELVEEAPRSQLAVRAIAGWLSPSPQLGNVPTLLQAVEPLPCRFSTQQLVDLLKMPTCVGEVRTVILEQLGNRYRRAFADQWEFVEFAEKQLPDIDLKSPPRRPQK